MIRVTGGILRGRRLRSRPGRSSRPTQGRVREALFSHLGDRLAGARAADLFAGSGVLGIEALSRGAAHVTFVERDHATAVLLRANLEACGLEARSCVIERDVAAAGPGLPPGGMDVVLADPPYADPWPDARAWRELARIIRPGGWLVLERPAGVAGEGWSEAFGKTFDRRYGDTQVRVLERRGDGHE